LHQLDEVILRNAENLRWAILRGIEDTFRRASFKFEVHLDNAIATTNGVVRQALERRQTNNSAACGELSRLRMKSGVLSELQKQFRSEQEDLARKPEGAK
jgi:hypothetical protein